MCSLGKEKGKYKMNKPRFTGWLWLVIAVILGVASFAGRDTSIVAGWLFLVWTLPFGVVWWFVLYDYALKILPASIAQPIGIILVIVAAYVFWFVVVPRLRNKGISHKIK